MWLYQKTKEELQRERIQARLKRMNQPSQFDENGDDLLAAPVSYHPGVQDGSRRKRKRSIDQIEAELELIKKHEAKLLDELLVAEGVGVEAELDDDDLLEAELDEANELEAGLGEDDDDLL
jgi:hypothetical protein